MDTPLTSAPFFTVILCVHRNQPHLAHAIRSILDQVDPDFEFLISANACDDALLRTLEGLVGSDNRVRIFRTDIGQLAFNLNFLADKAQGTYLVRMDSDDVSEPDRIAVLRMALEGDSTFDILGSWVCLINERGEPVGEMRLPCAHNDIVRAMPWGTIFCHPSVAIRREFLLRMRGYSGGFVSEDSDLWLRSILAGGRLGNLPQMLLHYRIHVDQSIRSRRGYAEMASLWLRELLADPSWFLTKGFVLALVKCMVSPLRLTRPPRRPKDVL